MSMTEKSARQRYAETAYRLWPVKPASRPRLSFGEAKCYTLPTLSGFSPPIGLTYFNSGNRIRVTLMPEME